MGSFPPKHAQNEVLFILITLLKHAHFIHKMHIKQNKREKGEKVEKQTWAEKNPPTFIRSHQYKSSKMKTA